MPKTHIPHGTLDSFGRVMLPEVLRFIEEDMDPDEVYEPERLLKCLLDYHLDLLQEAVDDGRV